MSDELKEMIETMRMLADRRAPGDMRLAVVVMPRVADACERLAAENERLKDNLLRCNCAPCDIGACNCGGYHRRPSHHDMEHDDLLEQRDQYRAALEKIASAHWGVHDHHKLLVEAEAVARAALAADAAEAKP